MRMKRRALVSTDEGARHPFRRSLPRHLRSGAEAESPRRHWLLSWRDWRDFAAAYCASFLAVTIFIS
jgi:hypothetical protein